MYTKNTIKKCIKNIINKLGDKMTSDESKNKTVTIESLKKICKTNIITASCDKTIANNKKSFIYPSEEELMLLDDESCQKTAIDKLLRNSTKDMANNTNTMCDMILSLMVEQTYTADEMFSDVDNALYEKLDDALNYDIQTIYKEYLEKAEKILANTSSSSSTSSSSTINLPSPPPITKPEETNTYKIISSLLDESYKDDYELCPDENNHCYREDKSTNENLYAKWIEQIPIDPETFTYTMPKIVVGHMDFEPEDNYANLNFRTIYNWEKQGKVLIDYKTGTVLLKETREKLGRVVEYARGYNDQETIQDLENKEREAEENDSSYKAMRINSQTGLSEEYDSSGKRINENKLAKIRIVGIEALMDDKALYEENSFNRALSGCGGSTIAIDREINEAKTGYKTLLTDWMSEKAFDNNPQHSLANGF